MGALEHLDWSLVQSFLAVAETGSLSAGARRLGLTQPTVGRHVQTLEQNLGISLFHRQARGMSLTDQGNTMLGHARVMREAAEALSLHAAGKSSDLTGTVRITASVFASHHYLPEIIATLREKHPEIDIELAPSDETENLLFREADIAVRMYRPTQLDMVTVHVGDVQLALFAAKRYLDRRGRPQLPEDFEAHDFVGYDRNDSMIRGFREAGIEVEREYFPIRCDNQTAVWELVRAGCGLGFAPLYAGQRELELELIDLGVPIPKMGVWLTAHEVVRRQPRVDLVWRVLAEGLNRVCDLSPS
ncbi:LysR family transcriptional regulator [Rhodobacteraceae bacterium]|nr:LysR family transcriptional regulator [Paracoccaceae bacterium]